MHDSIGLVAQVRRGFESVLSPRGQLVRIDPPSIPSGPGGRGFKPTGSAALQDAGALAVTWLSPNLEMDRTPSRSGSPAMDRSTGKVICCSISRGESDSAVVLICTWTGVVSGKASTGRLAME